MNYKKTFNFLKSLPAKLNSFYKKKSKSGIKVNNKSKNKYDLTTLTLELIFILFAGINEINDSVVILIRGLREFVMA